MPLARLTLVLTLLAALAACSGNDELELPEGANSSEAELYHSAQNYLNKESYDLAVRSLQLLESRFPFGKYAEQAQLEIIYAHYHNFEHEAAIEAADRFIRLHPQHPNVDYAFYMKGLTAYQASQGMLDRFVKADKTKRDTSYARESFAEFAQLLARFPGHISAAISSYNAGPERVARWLEDASPEDDEWVENIPYDQTRGYVKRVLRSIHAYRVLY